MLTDAPARAPLADSWFPPVSVTNIANTSRGTRRGAPRTPTFENAYRLHHASASRFMDLPAYTTCLSELALFCLHTRCAPRHYLH